MRMKTWMRWVWVCGCLAVISSHAQTQLPKELAPWESWVLDGREYLRCPFLADTSGSAPNERPCAWPGQLNIEIGPDGGKFTQQWTTYAESWLALPGSLEHWPSAVMLNGVLVPVVTRESTPQVRVGAGTHTLQGAFGWPKRPESLAIPSQTGLLSLTVDGRRVDQPERNEGVIWLGKQREADIARELNVQVYRLLTDGIPLILQTRLLLQVAGDVREESLP